MAENGIKTTFLNPVSTIDSVIGNRDGSTVRVPLVDFARQISGQAPEGTDEWLLAQKWAENPEGVPVLPDQFSALHHAKKSAAAEIVASTKAVLSTDQATISLTAANQSAVSMDQAQVAALAAGAPLVTTLTDPVPANGTVEILQTSAGAQVWHVSAGAWALVGWLFTPMFPSLAALQDAAGLIDGQMVEVEKAFNGGREYFTYNATSTLIADGAIIVTATGMGVGRLISTRAVYVDWAEFNADVRAMETGVSIKVRGAGGFTIVASGEHFTTSGGLKVTIADTLPTPQHYGTIDASGDAAAFTALFANHDIVRIPWRATPYTDVAVAIRSGQTILSEGATLKTTSTTAKILDATGKSGWSITGALFLIGTLVSAPTASLFTDPGAATAHTSLPIATGAGLYVEGCSNYAAENVIASNFAGHGIYTGGATLLGSDRGNKGKFSNCAAHDCAIGIRTDAGSGGEYCNWATCGTTGNWIGWRMTAGNHTVGSSSIVDNTVNIYMTAGVNHLHGIFSACNINHATLYNLHAKDVTLGHRFADCNWYGNGTSNGAIFLDNCTDIVLDGGNLDCWVYNKSGIASGYNYIRNMFCPGDYGDVYLLDAVSDYPSELIVTNCVGPGSYRAGVSISDPATTYVHAKREGASMQALSGATDLIFNTVDANGDRRAAYNNATGVFTVPAGQAGQYRINAVLYFSGTSLDGSASSIKLLVNGTATNLWIPATFGTTRLTASITIDRYLNAADLVKIQATLAGTANFGGASWESSLSIERIA
ncbi:MAG TPA: hypothetical protein ENH56_02785 [Roseobacter sp.]|uniref:Uncharacterized protein n=1 Tax=marine sediment metagenome TaxID=412755 RepID=A0A0F9RJ66_9ZZZZ|nr:hypothetical protein [Roseobacter sp.]